MAASVSALVESGGTVAVPVLEGDRMKLLLMKVEIAGAKTDKSIVII